MITIKYFFIDEKVLVSIYRNDIEFSCMQRKHSPSMKRLAQFVKESKDKYTSSVHIYSGSIIIFLVPRDA